MPDSRSARSMNTLKTCKVVLLGQEASGKSSLVERLVHQKFHEQCLISTIGASYAAKRIATGKGEVIVSVWDTAGAERFDSLTRLYYSGAQAALVCIDPTDSASYSKSQFWVKQLKEFEPNCRCYIVLTKCDLLEDQPEQLPPPRLQLVGASPQPPQGSPAMHCNFDSIAEDGDVSNADAQHFTAGVKKTINPGRTPSSTLDNALNSLGSSFDTSTHSSASRNSLDTPKSTELEQNKPRAFKRKAVSDSQLQMLVRSAQATLAYTSAASGQGIMELFEMIAEDLSEQLQDADECVSPAISSSQRSSMSLSRNGSKVHPPNPVVVLEKPAGCRQIKDACCR